MNEKEFLKNHPSFEKYSETSEFSELINWNEDSRGYDKELIKEAIQETQIDKQKVREAFLKIFGKGKRKSNDEILVKRIIIDMVYKELGLIE